MFGDVVFLDDEHIDIDILREDAECGMLWDGGERGQGLLVIDLPCSPEVGCLGDDEKTGGLYRHTMRFRPVTPDACIDPRFFYDVCEDMPNREVNVERTGGENKQQGGGSFQAKPTMSYAQIITQALRTSSTGKLTLSEIYAWIEKAFEYYRYANPVWKNSIRHNLSLNKCFKKVPRDPGTRGKGGRWTIDYEFLMKEESRKRRRVHAGRCGNTVLVDEDGSDRSGASDSDGRDDSLSGAMDDEVSMHKGPMMLDGFMVPKLDTSVKSVK